MMLDSMELDEREVVNGKIIPIIPLVRDSQTGICDIKIGDMATLRCKGKLIEAVIESMEGNFFRGSFKGSITNAADIDLRGKEIKFTEKNIFGFRRIHENSGD